jgi:hypothetical protein
MVSAKELGSLPLLQQLRDSGCPWDGYAWEGAAHAGCAELLQCTTNAAPCRQRQVGERADGVVKQGPDPYSCAVWLQLRPPLRVASLLAVLTWGGTTRGHSAIAVWSKALAV